MFENVPKPLGRAARGLRAGMEKTVHAAEALAAVPDGIAVSSPAFADDAPLPARFTADGEGFSPPLAWSGVPEGAAALALVIEDPDAPAPEPLVHAIAWDLPGGDGGLAEGALTGDGPAMGRNSALRPGYLPPDPPTGHGPHRYAFQVFALDRRPELDGAPGRGEFARLIERHAIAKGLLIGTYQRPSDPHDRAVPHREKPDMLVPLPTAPVRYDPSEETAAPDEAETTRRLNDAMRSVQETTCRDYGHAMRAVHAKSHGVVEGMLRVMDDLPPPLAQGLFARPASYPVVMRISTNPGDVLDDAVSAPRGLALKVIGVEGERLPGSEGDRTQDFVMVNAPAFAAPTPEAFAKNLSLLSATTDTGQGWKKALSAALRGAEAAVEAAGGKSSTLVTMGGQALTNPLGETFYTQAPFRHGDYVAKLSLAPASPALRALADRTVGVRGRPNALREEILRFFRDNDAEWELRVQLRTNPDTMPIEDASVPWPEEESPYLPVARVTVPRQPAWSEARARQVDDGMSFSPWHGLAAHRPLGGINRSRREAYASAAAWRAERNGCPMAEPAGDPGLARTPARPYGTAPGREGRRPGTPDARGHGRPQPLNETARHVVAGAAGGLAAGVLLSGAIAGMGAARGEADELAQLQRRTARRAGRPYRHEGAPPSVSEEAFAHGGHLALSAVAGAGYGLAHRGHDSPVASGLVFGLGFHALAYGVVGPALGVAPKPWRDTTASLAQHALLHAVFGVATALASDALARRL